MAAGEWPHRDFVDVYAPLPLALVGAALALGGGRILSVHVGVALFKALAVALGYRALRGVAGRAPALAGAALAALLWGQPAWNLNAPYASLFTVTLGVGALAAAVASLGRGGTGTALVSGVLGGLALLSKQSLGLLLTGGLGLAFFASAMLASGPDASEAPGLRPRRGAASLGLWAGAALALPIPLLPLLDAGSYLLFLLPIHGAMAAVAALVLRRGGCAPPLRLLWGPPGAFALGALLPVAGVVLTYAGAGGLPALLENTLGIPRLFTDYARPPEWPGAARGWSLVSLGLLSGAAAAAAAGRRRLAAAAGLSALGGLAALGAELLRPEAAPALLQAWRTSPRDLACLGIAAGGWAWGALWLGRAWQGPRREDESAGLAILFFHLFLAFQAFPRAGPDAWITLGAQPLALAAALHAAGRALLRPGLPAGRSRLAAALPWTLPVAVALPVLGQVAETAPERGRRELRLEAARGLSLSRQAIRRFHLDDLERVVHRLAALDPPAAPLVLVGNPELIAFASGRPRLFADEQAWLFWASWGLVSPDVVGRRLDEETLLARLRARPETIVVDPGDAAAGRWRRALPRVSAFLDREYAGAQRLGPYRILLRDPPPGSSSGRLVRGCCSRRAALSPAPGRP